MNRSIPSAALWQRRLALCSAWAWCSFAGAAGPVGAHDSAALEQLFWRCDYMSTHAVMDAGDAQVCIAASDRLRHARFGGDVEALLQWWRERKAAEHAALARGGASTAKSHGDAAGARRGDAR